MSGLASYAAQGLRWLGGWLLRVGAPAAQRAGLWALNAGGRMIVAVAHATVRHRTTVVAVAARLGWCAALWLLARGLMVLVGLEPLGSDREILLPFVVGLGIAVAIAAVAQERHLRRGAIVLGTANLVALLIAWTALGTATLAG